EPGRDSRCRSRSDPYADSHRWRDRGWRHPARVPTCRPDPKRLPAPGGSRCLSTGMVTAGECSRIQPDCHHPDAPALAIGASDAYPVRKILLGAIQRSEGTALPIGTDRTESHTRRRVGDAAGGWRFPIAMRQAFLLARSPDAAASCHRPEPTAWRLARLDG